MRVEARESSSGLELWWTSSHAEHLPARWYLFGYRGFTNNQDVAAVRQSIELHHLERGDTPAWVDHLGHLGIPIGLGTSGQGKSAQKSALAELFARMGGELGGYGSWWDVSFEAIKRTTAGPYRQLPLEIVLFCHRTDVAPYGWDENELSAWLNERRLVRTNIRVLGSQTEITALFTEHPAVSVLESSVNLWPEEESSAAGTAEWVAVNIRMMLEEEGQPVELDSESWTVSRRGRRLTLNARKMELESCGRHRIVSMPGFHACQLRSGDPRLEWVAPS